MGIATSLLEHPNFHLAVGGYCAHMNRPAQAGWPIRKFLNQLDRYYGCYMLIGLFYAWQHRGGAAPTLSRLQAESRLSARQTASLVQTLSATELILVEGDGKDRRQKILAPQPALIREVGRSIEGFVAAFDQITGNHLSRGLAESAEALGNLISLSIEVIRQGDNVIGAFPRVFAASEFDCGYPLLVGVMAPHYSTAPEPRGLTYAEMTERFQVSPSHVANVLAHFRRLGIIEQEKNGAVQADFCAEFEQWCAAEMEHYARLLQ